MMKNKKIQEDEFPSYTLWESFLDLEPMSTLRDWAFKLGKIIDWIPVLWNDYDFEDSHILRILDQKLKRVHKVLNEDPYHMDEKTGELSGPIYAKEVQEARDCIERILEHEYCKKEQEEHDNKFGKLEMIFDDEPSSFDKDGKPLTYSCHFTNVSTASRKSNSKICKLQEKRLQDDYRKLFNILETKSGCWWS